MKYIWYGIYILIQCTWGIAQTLVGFIFLLLHIKKPHSFFKGSINTKWDSLTGLSLGLFVFSPNENCEDLEKYTKNSKEELARQANMILVHEYGHIYQSLVLGPFYIIPGICSICWGRMKRYRKLRSKYGVPYSFYWTEQWADYWGEKTTKLPSIREYD